MRGSGRVRVLVGLALAAPLLLALVTGCGRRKFEPIAADSTGAMSPDSFAMRIREVQAIWDTGTGEEAARATALLILHDFRVRHAVDPMFDWVARANELLDSLGVGAELAGDRCAMAANFFARSDPSKGSWPWLFTCTTRSIDGQAIEGRDLRLLEVESRGVPPEPGGPAPGVAALFGRRAAMGYQPLLMEWSKTSTGQWSLKKTMGPDSLGGFGSAEFQPSDTTVELVARTYRPVPRFEECATCPHVYGVRRLRWMPAGFTKIEDRTLPSPYYAFVRFVTALSLGDREMAEELATDREWVETARREGFGESRGKWRAAPSTDETAHEMVFLRGKTEAWRIAFVQAGGDWKISGISSTTLAID